MRHAGFLAVLILTGPAAVLHAQTTDIMNSGRRTLTACTDPALAAAAVREEVCGRKVVLGAAGQVALG